MQVKPILRRAIWSSALLFSLSAHGQPPAALAAAMHVPDPGGPPPTPTRLYSGGTFSSTSVAFGTWGNTASAIVRPLALTNDVDDNATRATSSIGSSFPTTRLAIQFNSADVFTLQAQTISGNFRAQALASVSGTGNVYPAIRVAVYQNDLSTLRCELLNTSGSNTGTAVTSTTYTNRNYPASMALTPCACQNGDVLSIEVGGRATSGSSGTTYRVRYTGNAGTDLPVDNSTTSALNTWFEFENGLLIN